MSQNLIIFFFVILATQFFLFYLVNKPTCFKNYPSMKISHYQMNNISIDKNLILHEDTYASEKKNQLETYKVSFTSNIDIGRKLFDESLAVWSTSNPIGAFVQNFNNWEQCMRDVKFCDNCTKHEEWIESLFEEQHENLGCIVSMVGSNPSYQNWFRRSLENWNNQLFSTFNYPIILFHFNIDDTAMNDLQSKYPNLNITFVKLFLVEPMSPVSWRNSKPKSECLLQSSTVEYRFQSVVYPKIMYLHPATQGCRYIMRIDNDIEFVHRWKYDIFKLMSENEFIQAYHHWGFEPDWARFAGHPLTWLTSYFKNSVNPSSVYFGDTLNRLPPPGTAAGGAWTITLRSFFNSPRLLSYYYFIECLGGIWSHRWSDQTLLPQLVALFADDSEKRTHILSNVQIFHGGALYPPHKVPEPWNGIDAIETNLKIVNKKNVISGAIVYYLDSFDFEQSLISSIINLNVHFTNRYRYPIYIVVNDELIIHSHILLLQHQNNVKIIMVGGIVKNFTRSEFLLRVMPYIPELLQFDYIMYLHPKTIFIANVNLDPFKTLHNHNLDIGYHRMQKTDASKDGYLDEIFNHSPIENNVQILTHLIILKMSLVRSSCAHQLHEHFNHVSIIRISTLCTPLTGVSLFHFTTFFITFDGTTNTFPISPISGWPHTKSAMDIHPIPPVPFRFEFIEVNFP